MRGKNSCGASWIHGKSCEFEVHICSAVFQLAIRTCQQAPRHSQYNTMSFMCMHRAILFMHQVIRSVVRGVAKGACMNCIKEIILGRSCRHARHNAGERHASLEYRTMHANMATIPTACGIMCLKCVPELLYLHCRHTDLLCCCSFLDRHAGLLYTRCGGCEMLLYKFNSFDCMRM
jgi:hypothetical protein